MENRIKDALIRLLESIKRSDTQGILHGMEEVEDLAGRANADLHPQLAHFLERRSYAKALDYLETNGSSAS
jgi:hypothetical protein